MNLYVRFITADESISFTHDHVQHRETNNEFWTRIPIYNGVKMQSWSCGIFLHRMIKIPRMNWRQQTPTFVRTPWISSILRPDDRGRRHPTVFASLVLVKLRVLPIFFDEKAYSKLVWICDVLFLPALLAK
mmetsp:Transcript_1171/g.2210  ORF Transcript_1171/g.2210 Transcript_1171/m.2210 type:complete len:131 (-) Transcript_1171:352-744(-)